MMIEPIQILGEYKLSQKDQERWMGNGSTFSGYSSTDGRTAPHPLLRDLELDLDPLQTIRSPVWHYRHARVGRGVLDADYWHKDDFDGRWQLVWANRNPTLLRWKGKVIQPAPNQLVLFNNAALMHKSPVFSAQDLNSRWFMRVFLVSEYEPFRLTKKRLEQIRAKMKG